MTHQVSFWLRIFF